MKLTAQQIQILEYVAAGQTQPQIAKAMNITVGAVRMMMFRIYDRLGAENSANAVAIAMARGDIHFNA